MSHDPPRSNRAAQQALAQALASQPVDAEHVRLRAEPRYQLPSDVSVIAQIDFVGGSTQAQVSTVRDLSRSGLAMLWQSFLHPGTRTHFTFVNAKRQPIQSISGEVVRCTHVKGHVHDVGVRFREKIDLGTILGPALEGAGGLRGCVIALEPMVENLLDSVRAGESLGSLEHQLAKITTTLLKVRDELARDYHAGHMGSSPQAPAPSTERKNAA